MENSQAILVHPKQFEIEECPIPEPKAHEILMKVEYVGMCGSDIHGFEFGPYKKPKPGQKVGLGHEVAGEVVKIGSEVTKFKVGDKVLIEPGVPDDTCEYCRSGHYNVCPDVDFLATAPNFKGAYTKYMTHPESWTYHIPEGMSTLEAALVEPAAVGMHAAILGGAKLGSHIVILGCGTIGLMTLQACLSLGATDITMVDMIQKKLDFAKKLGARQIINTADIKPSEGDRCTPDDIASYLRSDEQFGRHGVDLVFECSGSGFLAQVAVGIVAFAGKIMMVGTQAKPVPVDFGRINREVTIMTTFRYCNNFPQTIEAIATGKFNVKDMVTGIYDYKDIQKAFEEAIDPVKKQDLIKGVIRIGGTED
ncbi:MAG: NAD(P)-dependent alcohol dehydrogenase [Lachnospiraceae bacterium]|jgi:threonine dehydrogenase-like Zn-dependent dehydrogenase|nr:NAD(P)-dependent alcohol dehydrogenase [Lachnospiraceae bacterium]MCH4064985.1 NAD(P)-dependent alcohol dehydrogenase [Lachnospiraceae bacterium]MCH4103961.1 NAD(P)-dependent alcohol dehydrogenase [Lachnospiraceae bacterium]